MLMQHLLQKLRRSCPVDDYRVAIQFDRTVLSEAMSPVIDSYISLNAELLLLNMAQMNDLS